MRIKSHAPLMYVGMTAAGGMWETKWTILAGTIHPSTGLPLSLPLPPSGEPSNVDAAVRWMNQIHAPSPVPVATAPGR